MAARAPGHSGNRPDAPPVAQFAWLSKSSKTLSRQQQLLQYATASIVPPPAEASRAQPSDNLLDIFPVRQVAIASSPPPAVLGEQQAMPVAGPNFDLGQPMASCLGPLVSAAVPTGMPNDFDHDIDVGTGAPALASSAGAGPDWRDDDDAHDGDDDAVSLNDAPPVDCEDGSQHDRDCEMESACSDDDTQSDAHSEDGVDATENPLNEAFFGLGPDHDHADQGIDDVHAADVHAADPDDDLEFLVDPIETEPTDEIAGPSLVVDQSLERATVQSLMDVLLVCFVTLPISLLSSVALPILRTITAPLFHRLGAVVVFCQVIILKLMSRYQITQQVTNWVLTVLSYVFGLFGVKFPRNVGDVLRGLGVQAQLDSLLEQRYIFCPQCHTVYKLSECIRLEAGCRVSKTCSKRDLGKVCKAVLLQTKLNKRGVRVLYPLPSQKLIYPGVLPQVQRILKRPNILTNWWHHLDRQVPPGVLSDIYDGMEWKRWRSVQRPQDGLYWFSMYGVLDLAFILNVDAFNPFKHGFYSIYALYMCLANLPRAERHLSSNLILVALCPGTFNLNVGTVHASCFFFGWVLLEGA